MAARRYDLVLMDCQMPVMDGYTGHARWRETRKPPGRRPHLPIVAMTANAMAGDRQKCLDAGMDDYLVQAGDARANWNVACSAGCPRAAMRRRRRRSTTRCRRAVVADRQAAAAWPTASPRPIAGDRRRRRATGLFPMRRDRQHGWTTSASEPIAPASQTIATGDSIWRSSKNCARCSVAR